MGTLEIVMGIILLVFALFLIVAVLMQSAKDKRLSGAIAGGAESFLGKDRGSRLDKLLNIITPIVAGVFAVLVIVMYCIVA
ncbi:MAG: preprotein translocase subunit SecG [Clostridia bacterium]|nr:preprotein translocase subunit SecG [Clostridia bacterium]